MAIVNFNNRKKYVFRNLPVQIKCEDGETMLFPCIVLWNIDIDVPVAYPGYERWLFRLSQAELQSYQTLKKKAYNLCSFLNYILWNSYISRISDLELNDIRGWIMDFRKTSDGTERDPDSWNRGIADVYAFLSVYYEANRDMQKFKYMSTDLLEIQIIKNPETKRKSVIRSYNKFSVKAPKKLKKKNRLLLPGYLDMILCECKKYDPEITFAVVLQAYAGLREGEVVNLTRGKLKLVYAGFGRIGKIVLDLTEKAPFAVNPAFGQIKVPRKQEVYIDFVNDTVTFYNQHCDLLDFAGASRETDAPLFLNKYGKPLSVAAYSHRLKTVFQEHFVPDLKRICELQGSWAQHAPYIESFEKEYPGAHMFRHWFTMHLLNEGISSDEITKWRGDTSRESMLDYIHVNADMIRAYQDSAYTFQQTILEEILL